MEKGFTPRKDQDRSRSLVRRTSPSCPPHPAALALVLSMCRGAVPEGGTPDSLTYVPSCVKPSRHTPKSAGTA